MASEFSAVRALMLADVKALSSLQAAVEAPIAQAPQRQPYAKLIWGDAEYRDDTDIGNIRQRDRILTIEIWGKKREAVDLPIEQLQDLWDEQPQRAALAALNAWAKPITDYPSYETEDAAGWHVGVLQLLVSHRTAITGV